MHDIPENSCFRHIVRCTRALSVRAYGVRRFSVKSAGSRLAHQREGKQTEGVGWVRVLPMRCNSDMGHKVMTSPTGRKPCSSSAIVCSVTGLQVHCTLSLYTDTPTRPAVQRRPTIPRAPARCSCLKLTTHHSALFSPPPHSPLSISTRVDKIGYRMKNRDFQLNAIKSPGSTITRMNEHYAVM